MRMMALPILLSVLAACAGPLDLTDHTDPWIDTGLDEACSVQAPNGWCNGSRFCAQGACVLDVDRGAPADPLDTLESDWTAIWSEVDRRYGAFEAKPDLDWAQVRTQVLDELASAETELEAVDTMARGLNRIGDGHTYLRHPACDGLPVPAFGWSNTGVCFVETDDGAIRVGRLFAGAPPGLALGDVLVDVDERATTDLITDLGRQPGCPNVGSRPAMDRRRFVHTLGWREVDEELGLTSIDGSEQSVRIDSDQRFVRCDGRPELSLAAEPGGVSWATFDQGGLLYVTFPFFGTYNASNQFVVEPMRTSLEEVLAEHQDVSGLILDLRGNGGGYASIYLELAGWLYGERTVLFYDGGPTRTGGQPFAYEAVPNEVLSLADVPVAVLTDETSFSAADFTAGFLIQTGRARAFGQPTGGGFGSGDGGSVGEYRVGINTFYALDLDLRPLEGNPPGVGEPLLASPEDVAAGRDTVLEAAKAWLREQ